MPLEFVGREGNWCRHLCRGPDRMGISTSCSQSFSVSLFQYSQHITILSLFQDVFLCMFSRAFPIRNAAVSMPCGNRDGALPAKQIHSCGSTVCFPIFSQETIIYYFCGFFCLLQETEVSISEKTSIRQSSCWGFSVSLV